MQFLLGGSFPPARLVQGADAIVFLHPRILRFSFLYGHSVCYGIAKFVLLERPTLEWRPVFPTNGGDVGQGNTDPMIFPAPFGFAPFDTGTGDRWIW